MLSAAEQDYLEIVYRLESDMGPGAVRISDIANQLQTRLPTVSRTIKRLAQRGLVTHKPRQPVGLTPEGNRIAGEIVHRHDDLVKFFTRILGLQPDEAESVACQIEHGFSPQASQRLHEFLLHVKTLHPDQATILTDFGRTDARTTSVFTHLPTDKAVGWRG